MGLCSLGSDDNVGTILGSLQGNGLADATAGPSDEEGASC